MGARPDSPEAWLARARSDLALAQAVLALPGVLPEDACYHARQCAEKALKALLIHLRVQYPRTRIISTLLHLIEEQGVDIAAGVDAAFSLTQYATLTRYPTSRDPVTVDDTRDAVELARTVLAWVEEKVGS